MVEEDSKEEANTVGGDASKPVGGVVRGKQFVPKKKDHEIGMCLACRMCVLRNQVAHCSKPWRKCVHVGAAQTLGT